MSLYFLLGTLTATGQQKVHDNRDLFVEATRSIQVEGAEILGQYAVLGRYDFVMMVEADDNDAVARLSLDLGVRIGLHIETLPAIAIGFLTERTEGNPVGRPTSVQLRPDE
jgi:uncharacterized protein with GYD domain